MSSRAKKAVLPLTQRAYAGLKKYGPMTSDGLAKKLRVDAADVVKALSKLKQNERAHFKPDRATKENVWRTGKARTR